MTAKQNLEEQLDEVQMQILEAQQNLFELQTKEKYINSKLEAFHDVLAQSAETVRLSKDVDFDKLAGF